jgi:phosphohistidine phosphatase SixA
MGRLHALTLGTMIGVLLTTGCQAAAPPAPTATSLPAKPEAVATVAAPASPSPAASPLASPAASPMAAVAASPSPVAQPVASPVPSPSPAAAAASPVAAAASPAAEASPVAQVSCDFVFGFAALRDRLGPPIVGECTENQREVPGNLTAEQRTTKGIMIYRPQEGSTSFSDGSRTWIIGPRGLVERPANQRFEWEADRQAIEAVQRGGHFIYFRHGPTNRSEQDSDPTNLANCATQRNLTDEGRAQARTIGEALRKLNIPVGRVLSSEYCRALEYSRLMLDRAEVEPNLVLPDPLTAEERGRNTEGLLRILASPPPADTNVVMVAHSPNIRDAVDVDLPVEGGAVILRPNPGSKPTPVILLLPGEWTALAEALGR